MEGIILINKEKGYTSHDVVAIAKKTLGEKIGHTGTLDPDATGVLPLLVGRATKISKYIVNHDKVYKAVLKLGKKTDTLDATGNIIEEMDVKMPTTEEIENVFLNMVGMQEQIPPMYSAIKVNGKKLYEYARKGETIEVEPRTIEIYSLKLDNVNNEEQEITYTVHCSKGTYIRTLCEQIATNLNTIGYMKELERLQVGDFKIEDSITIGKLIEDKDNAVKNIITIEKFFENKEKVILGNKRLEQFLNGLKINVQLKNGVARVYNNENKFIGLGMVRYRRLKRDVIL